MTDAREEGKDCDPENASPKEGVSCASASLEARASHIFPPIVVDQAMHSALLATTQGVPNVWPEDLNIEREEFSSICIAGEDLEPSNSTGNPKIILRLRNRAVWRAKGPHQIEMSIRRKGMQIISK